MAVKIFWSVVAGFAVGVFLRSFLPLGWYAAGFFGVLGVSLLLLSWGSRSKAGIVIGMALLACTGGILRMHEARLVGDVALNQKLEQKVVIEGYVFEEPDSRENNIRLSVRAEKLIAKDVEQSVKAGVLVVVPLHTIVSYGDLVRAEGTLRLPRSFATEKGGDLSRAESREFNYPAFLAKDGIGYELAFADVEKTGEGWKNPLKAGAIWVKQTYLQGLGMALPEPQAGLAGGITAGDKRALGGELTDIFRTVGLIHIIVLSGYNIMIVMYGIGWLLEKFGVRGWGEATIGIMIACFFALMTGLAAASVRAAAMASIAFVGKALPGRVYLANRVLAFVAAGMVLWNPYILAFDPGFQLSVIATWGMLAFSPHLASKLWFLTDRLALREIAATTMATQLTVLPLLLYQNGTLSLVSLPANLLALIAVPWAMLASFIAGLFGIFAGPIAPIIGFPAYFLLSYILLVAEWAARIPFASVSVGSFGFGAFVISYIVLIIIGLWKTRTVPVEKSRPV